MLDSTLLYKIQPLLRACCLVPLAAAFAIAAACWMPRMELDSQAWIHIELGETILQRGELPVSTQVAAGYCWMNDCWLTQVIMAIINRVGGVQALSAVICCIGLLIVAAVVVFN